MILSLRLSTILDMTPQSVVADVGSDHGKLMIALFLSGKIKKGYAIENKQGPFNRLVDELRKNKVIDYIEPIFGDGLEKLPEDVETLILAGLGGTTIVDILKKDISKLANINTIIVDAHSEIPLVRMEITKLGFSINKEKIIKEDNIYYEIIRFNRSALSFYSEFDYEFGPILRNEKSATFKEKYTSRIHSIDKLLECNNKLPLIRQQELLNEKQKLKKVI